MTRDEPESRIVFTYDADGQIITGTEVRDMLFLDGDDENVVGMRREHAEKIAELLGDWAKECK